MSRTIDFIGRGRNKLKTKTITIKLRKVRTTKLRQIMIETGLGYVDVTVSLDRWGRLNAVLVEKSNSSW